MRCASSATLLEYRPCGCAYFVRHLPNGRLARELAYHCFACWQRSPEGLASIAEETARLAAQTEPLGRVRKGDEFDMGGGEMGRVIRVARDQQWADMQWLFPDGSSYSSRFSLQGVEVITC